MSDKKICPFCMKIVVTGTHCAKCLALSHNSCAEKNILDNQGTLKCCKNKTPASSGTRPKDVNKAPKAVVTDVSNLSSNIIRTSNPFEQQRGTSPVDTTVSNGSQDNNSMVPGAGLTDSPNGLYNSEQLNVISNHLPLDTLNMSGNSISSDIPRDNMTAINSLGQKFEALTNKSTRENQQTHSILKSINGKIQSFDTLISNNTTNIAYMGGKIQNLITEVARIDSAVLALYTSTSTIPLLQQDLQSVSNRVASVDTIVNTLSNASAAPAANHPIDPQVYRESMAFELQDRMNRSRNLMIFNFMELVGQPANSDLLAARNLRSSIVNLNLTHIEVRRLGAPRTDGSARPLVVQLQSPQDVLTVIRYRSKLPNGVAVSSDKTRAQREKLKQLHATADAHNVNNPGSRLIVKYQNGVPRLVEKNSWSATASKN